MNRYELGIGVLPLENLEKVGCFEVHSSALFVPITGFVQGHRKFINKGKC